jgi:hypothetical protein
LRKEGKRRIRVMAERREKKDKSYGGKKGKEG